MPVRCGIDLGTTYSAISWFDPFNNRVDTIDLDSANGNKIIRSVVYYPGGGNPVVVGDTAWNAKQQYPARVIDHIKRSMGTNYRAPAIDGAEFTPPQVSAEILKALVKDAETFLAEEVKDVVITVPAYFGEPERAATEEAGKLAGLNVLALLEEPHAAALAYAVDKVAEIVDKYLLVYDLGGGTFDVTLIHATTAKDPGDKVRLKIDTLCKGGDRSLGGLNWDDVLAEIVATKAQQQYGLDLRNDAKRNAMLMDQCEKAKRHLSQTATVPVVVEPPDKVVEVTLGEFEDATRDLLNQTQMFLEQVLRDAEGQHHLAKDRIDVMLTGGSSKMPMVKNMIQGVMGRPPFKHRNLELLVTIGAAYWSHLLEGHTIDVALPQADGTVKTGGLEVVSKPSDISTYSIGVEVLRADGQGGYRRQNSIVLPKGARYGDPPVEKEWQTSEEGMTEIPVVLYKGESANIDECQQLMVVTIAGLPPGRPKGQRVKVQLGYDTNGILRGTAVDVSSAQQVDIVMDRSRAASTAA